jgi:DNA-binding PadR family transcriptional regulator
MSEIANNILKSFSFLTILIELSKGKKMTGYELVVHITSFGFKAHIGTVYHQLGMLSELGFIRGEEQETRSKYARRGATAYKMTEKGMKAFEEFKKKWKKPLEYAYQNLHT